MPFNPQSPSKDEPGDRSQWLWAAYESATWLRNAPTSLLADRQFMTDVVRSTKDTRCVEYATEELKNNKLFLLDVLAVQTRWNGELTNFTSPRLRDDKDVAIAAVLQNSSNWSFISHRFRDDEDFVMAAVQRSGWGLEYASERLRDDPVVVTTAIQGRYWGGKLKYASDRLRDDSNIVKTAIQGGGSVLKYASDRLRDDLDVVMEAVRENANNIAFASERLRRDKRIVIPAMASESFMEAAKIGNIPWWLPNDVWDNKEFALQIAMVDPVYLRYASSLRSDEEALKALVKKDSKYLDYMDLGKLVHPKAKEILMVAVERDGLSLRYACKRPLISKGLHGDKELVAAAVSQNGLSLKYASRRLKRDRDIVLAAVEQGGTSASLLANKELRDDKEVRFVSQLGDLHCKNMLQPDGNDNIPISLWPHILEKVNGNLWCLYHYLQNKSDQLCPDV